MFEGGPGASVNTDCRVGTRRGAGGEDQRPGGRQEEHRRHRGQGHHEVTAQVGKGL